MDKNKLKLPKKVLEGYVKNKIKELTVDDFFQVSRIIDIPASCIEKNKSLKNNKKVLNYMLNKDINSYFYFDYKAFDENSLERLANSNVVFNKETFKKFPQFLKHDKLCKMIVEGYPGVVKEVKLKELSDDIIRILEDSNIVLNEDDFINNPGLYVSSKLIKLAIENGHPRVIVGKKFNLAAFIPLALDNGYIPKFDDFKNNYRFQYSNALIDKALEYDPKVIIFKDDISDEDVISIRKRGYIASEEDLNENERLCKIKDIMIDAIRRNPKLIKYAVKETHLEESFIDEILEKYEITKNDFLWYPELGKIEYIIRKYPQYRLFSRSLTVQEKEDAIVDLLKNDEEMDIYNLPFFSLGYGGLIDFCDLNKIANLFAFNIDEKDYLVQKGYFKILDKIIDSIVNIRYIKNKGTYKFVNVVDLNNSFINLFKNIENPNNIDTFANELYDFTEGSIPLKEIYENIVRYYKIFKEENRLDNSVTIDFYNHILNEHRNNFMSKEKQKIMNEIKSKMRPTKKKKDGILNGKKIIKIQELIKNKNFEELRITKEEFKNLINKVKEDLLRNRDIIKSGINIKSESLDYLEKLFMLKGCLIEDDVISVLNIESSETTRFIAKKFEQIKFKFISKITLTKTESDISREEIDKVGSLNDTNYIICDKDIVYRNIAKILLILDDEILYNIKEYRIMPSEILKLLPFINLIDELDTQTFINIIINYKRIMEKFISTNNKPNLETIIDLANAYNYIDDLTLLSLGKNVLSKVEDFNASSYLDFYHKLLYKRESHIPSVSFETEQYSLKSGQYTDPERLIIGHILDVYTCIDLLNPAGVDTYNKVLLGDKADVILIRDKNEKLISRIFVFREGNIIQITSSHFTRYPIELYEKIVEKMVENIDENDNIDYIFVNECCISNVANHPRIEDYIFEDKFPHADFTNAAYLIKSKMDKPYSKSNINLKEDMKCTYEKVRKEVSYDANKEDITRLRALNVTLQTSYEEKEELSRNFEEYNTDNYVKAVCGEDWYIAIKNDGNIEELVLPLNDPKTYEEISEVKKYLGINNKEKILKRL